MPQGMETTRQRQDKAEERSAKAFEEALKKLPKRGDVKRKKGKSKKR